MAATSPGELVPVVVLGRIGADARRLHPSAAVGNAGALPGELRGRHAPPSLKTVASRRPPPVESHPRMPPSAAASLYACPVRPRTPLILLRGEHQVSASDACSHLVGTLPAAFMYLTTFRRPLRAF